MQCTQSMTVSCDRFVAFNKALNGYCILSWIFFQVHRQVIGDMHQVYLQVRVNTISAACYGTSAGCKSTRLSTCGTASNGRRDMQRRDVKGGTCKEGTCKEGVDRGGRLRVDESRLWRVPPELQDVAQLWLPHGVHHEHRT